MDITQTDSEMARNEPIEVFSTGEGGGVNHYKIRALSISKAEEWMEKANAVESLHKAVELATKCEDREVLAAARKAYNAAVVDCVFSYDTDALPEEKLRDVITPAQLARAFALMQLVNDPFVSAGIVQLNIQKQAMKGLPMKLIEKQLTGNGSTRD